MTDREARRRFEAVARALRDADGAVSPGEAALWIAAEEYPGLEVAAVRARLDGLGHVASERVTPEMDAPPVAAALGRLLFEEEEFRGNAADYYDPRNSFLSDVLERRLGIPITLSVVYMEVAARAGVVARGVGLPGHFVVRVERGGTALLVDPFHGGRPLDRADCATLVRQATGVAAPLEPGWLRPVSTRALLVRLLANLKGIHVRAGDFWRALAAVERMLLLEPEAWGELRDRGAIHARLGQDGAAIRDWERYLAQIPEAPDAGVVRTRLRALRMAQADRN